MRILIEGRSYRDYIAKCHEAFRTGLRALFDVRCFGKGYAGYSRFVKTYEQVVKRTFAECPFDILIADSYFPEEPQGFKYRGIQDVIGLKSFILGDYWELAEHHFNEFAEFVQRNRIDIVLTYFPQPMEIWAGSPIGDRFVYLPPSFDPTIFNDWGLEKKYDVGFLAAGTTERLPLYPERFNIHARLLECRDIKYFCSSHPGWGWHRENHPLVGAGFSKAINQCRMFITTAGRYRNAHAKYIEILASSTLLLAEEPIGAEAIRLKNGINYVRITKDDVIDKVRYYLDKPELCERIARQGYADALKYHSCYSRAFDFYAAIANKINQH